MSTEVKFEGFAYHAGLRRHHIFVDVPTRLDEDVVIVEDFSAKESPREKARLPLRFFDRISTPLTAHFNQRIAENPDLNPCPRARFVRGKRIPMDLLLGRELLVLAWAIEPWEHPPERDPVFLHLPRALDTWLSMPPEERWTLFRLTNAKAGYGADAGKGWRRALRYGLCGEVGETLPTILPAPVRRKKKAPAKTPSNRDSSPPTLPSSPTSSKRKTKTSAKKQAPSPTRKNARNASKR
jgi:hypothetical protein